MVTNMKKRLIASTVLFAFATVMAAYAVWTVFYCADIVSQAIEAGSLVFRGFEYDIISFYMSYVAQYVAYALLLAAAGLIVLWALPTDPENDDGSAGEAAMNEELDRELDEFFSEADSAGEDVSAEATENVDDNTGEG